MQHRTDPTALRWLIGGDLARLREHGGLSMSEVAEASGLAKAKIGHMEIGRVNQDPDELSAILTACDAPKEDIERLQTATQDLHGRPWWKRWKAIVPDWYGLYLGLEGMATKLFVYELAAVHGLLQTREYANDVTDQASLVDSQNADRYVALRMERAERLQSEPVLDFHAVIDEAALHRKLNAPEVMAEQCEHMLNMSKLPNVTLQVIPTERGLHGGIGMGNYAILDFKNLNGVAYSELYGDALFIREPTKVKSYHAAAEHIAQIALTPDETRQFIREVRKKAQ